MPDNSRRRANSHRQSDSSIVPRIKSNVFGGGLHVVISMGKPAQYSDTDKAGIRIL